jgi:hypothetical protein
VRNGRRNTASWSVRLSEPQVRSKLEIDEFRPFALPENGNSQIASHDEHHPPIRIEVLQQVAEFAILAIAYVVGQQGDCAENCQRDWRRIASSTAMPASPTSTKSGASPDDFAFHDCVRPCLRTPHRDASVLLPASHVNRWGYIYRTTDVAGAVKSGRCDLRVNE